MMENVTERKNVPSFTLDDCEDVSKYLSKRRHTERIPDGLSPFRCRQNNHSYGNRDNGGKKSDKDCRCSKRRHTLVPGVSEVELFEKETKLIVLEFLQVSTPRLLNAKSPGRDIPESLPEGEVKTVFVVEEKLCVEEHQKCAQQSNKREVKRQRKVSKSKTVTLGENDRKEINEYQIKEQRKKFKRSTSDMTSLQYSMMRRKFQQMQSPIIQWLKDHIEEETDDDDNVSITHIPEKKNVVIEDEISNLEINELESIPENTIIDDSSPTTDDDEEPPPRSKRYKNNVS